MIRIEDGEVGGGGRWWWRWWWWRWWEVFIRNTLAQRDGRNIEKEDGRGGGGGGEGGASILGFLFFLLDRAMGGELWNNAALCWRRGSAGRGPAAVIRQLGGAHVRSSVAADAM